MTVRSVAVQGGTIDLGALLKLAGLADTGGQAKVMIRGGGVRVNGQIERRRGRKLVDGVIVEVQGHGAVVVKAP